MKNPCRRDCPKRRAGTKDRPSCHADCKEYQAFWAANRVRNEEKVLFSSIDGLNIDGIRKAKAAARLMKGKTYQDKR